ncbi:GAF domain-containing sensor histidine kinase [Massilia consociata]|uniref:histidine kinase n=1 Tax=Massilia consociata TaxID=760117 RepID=A0ABV6FIF8_9BURK
MMPAPLENDVLLNLHDLCGNATVALFVMNHRQHCVYMNPAAEHLTGYTLAEVQGAPLHNFVHHTRPDGSHYPLEECPIDRAAPRDMQERGKEMFVHKDGSLYPVTFTASPIRRQGTVVGTVIEVQDARPQQEQERQRDALHKIGLLILQELDHKKIVQAVTDTATRLTGAQFGAFFYNVRNEHGESLTLYTISGVPEEHFTQFPLPRKTQLFGPTFMGEGTIRSDNIRHDPRYGQAAPHDGMPAGHLPVCSYLAVPVRLGDGHVIGGLFFGHEDEAIFKAEHELLVETLAAQAAVGLNKAFLYEDAVFAQRRAEQDALEKQRLYRKAAQASEQLVGAQEDERKRLARELHDELGQRLSVLNMLLYRMQPSVSGTPAAQVWRDAERELATLVSQVRNISLSLRPPGLDYFGLEPALEQLLARQFDGGPPYLFECALPAGRLPPLLEITAYRIVQESITNIVRYAQASHVVVEINGGADGAELEIIVRDNGRGFDSEGWEERYAGTASSGMAGMRERVLLLGGRFIVHSRPGLGTRVEATLPVHSSGRASAWHREATPLSGR